MSNLKILKIGTEFILEAVSFTQQKNIERSAPSIQWTITPKGGSPEIIGTGKAINYKITDKYAGKEVVFRAFIKKDSYKMYPQQCLTCFIEEKVSTAGILIKEVDKSGSVKVEGIVECKVTRYNKPSDKITEAQKRSIKWDVKIGNEKKKIFVNSKNEPYRGEIINFTVPTSWDGKSVLLMPYMNQSVERVSAKINIKNSNNAKSCIKCINDWTKEDIKKMDSGLSDAKIDDHILGINIAFKDCQINNCLRKIHFLAQILHESGNLRYTREIRASDTDYGGFPGRGLIQLTGKTNYEKYGTFANVDVTSSLDNKKKLESSPHAAKSAGWFWSEASKLNDEADENDFIFITRTINGGFNGYNDRLKKLKKAFVTIYKECECKGVLDTDYKLKDSKVYNEARGTFAWGLWHDPDLDKSGCTKDKDKAIEGYERYLALTANEENINWYNIQKMNAFAGLVYYDSKDTKKEKAKVKVKEAAELRLKELKK